jgi:hypothetical protein
MTWREEGLVGPCQDRWGWRSKTRSMRRSREWVREVELSLESSFMECGVQVEWWMDERSRGGRWTW